MSFTGRFSPMYQLDQENKLNVQLEFSKHAGGVRITDIDGLEDDLNDTLFNQAVITEYTDRSEYPNKVWKTFNGFTTFGNGDNVDDHPRYYNVSKLGWTYAQSEFIRTMEALAENLEPFFVWHYSGDGYFPPILDIMEYDNIIYRIEGNGGGNITVIEVTVGPDVANDEEVNGIYKEEIVYKTEEDRE